MLNKPDFIDSLEAESLDVSGKDRGYPGIEEYYLAACKNTSRPINSQKGLSNYSCLVFGDDRISYSTSMSQESFAIHQDLVDSMAIVSEQTQRMEGKTPAQRRRDYMEATEIVGDVNLDRMEEMMRDKLQQRTKAGPFELRKTFKYFDRDQSGGIDIGEFSSALELMGFQFNEMQILALFGRYDVDALGHVDYQGFVDKLIDSDFGGVRQTATGRKLANVVDHIVHPDDGYDSEEDEKFQERGYGRRSGEDEDALFGGDQEQERMRQVEIRRVFNMIDRNHMGFINKKEFELLLMALNLHLTAEEIDLAMARLGDEEEGTISFENFMAWWDQAGL
jgi:Ca2+-binding EF-hand superfamily protein